MSESIITRQQVSDHQRVKHTADLFGVYFPIRIEPYIFSLTAGLSADYEGAYWQFYSLSNGGFYMAPEDDRLFHVIADNGYEGHLSADALGITACLYAYSHLSFRDNLALAKPCAEQYHLLREFMLEHKEAVNILRSID